MGHGSGYSAHSGAEQSDERHLAWWHVLIIFFIPIAGLLTFRRGYSSTARVLSVIWLVVAVSCNVLRVAGREARLDAPTVTAAQAGTAPAEPASARAAFVQAFTQSCVKRSPAAHCNCVAEGIYDAIPEAELEKAIEAMRNGRPDVRVGDVLVKCDRR